MEQNVPVKMVLPTMCTPASDWLVETRTLSDGVHVARVLLPCRDTHSSVRVINLTEKPFTLDSGLNLGSALEAQALSTTREAHARVQTVTSREEDGSHDHLKPVFDSLPSTLSVEEREGAIEFIKEYPDVFSKSEFDLGRTTLITHNIDTGDAKPIRQGLRRQAQIHLDVIDHKIAKMESSGVIEPSCSPWASNVVVVTKHDKTPRITLDYRQLNNVTYKDSYPLPV